MNKPFRMALWDNIYKVAGTDNKINSESKQRDKKDNKKDKRIDCNNANLILSHRGVSMSTYLIDDLNIKRKLINYFTINISTLTGYVMRINNHITDINAMNLVFPRFGFIEYAKKHFKNYNIINKIKNGKPPSVSFKWTGKFTNNQPLIVKHIMENYFTKKNVADGTAGLILNLKAGQGKTFLATGLMEKIQKKTLVVCHNKTILHQWTKVLKQSYPKNKIAHFYSEKKEDGDVVVGIINTLSKQSPGYFKDFGYIILDEVHEYCSKTRKKIYLLGQSSYMLGLSATPNERTDGLDQVNIWQCGSILNAAELEGYTEEDIPFTGKVKTVKYVGPEEHTKIITNATLDIVSFSKMLTQICEDPYRIHLIVKTIYELRQKNMQVLVFADRRRYLEQIREELDRFHIINDVLDDIEIKSQRVVGGAKAEEIEHAEAYANVILSSYQFFGTGKSIPKLDAVVLTTPRKRKSKQFIGRIFRVGGDYSIKRQIIDIVDWATPLKGSYYKRKKYYNDSVFPITETKVNYETLEAEMIEMGIMIFENEDGTLEDNVVEKSLDELESMLNKQKILDLDIEDLELLNCSDPEVEEDECDLLDVSSDEPIT